MRPSEALPGRSAAIPTAERHFVNGNPLKGPYPAGLETAVFALGCYWGAERKFWQVPGVWVTAVGNAGGFTPNPSYEEVCSGLTGHAESVLVVFDPAQVSYEQLLKLFFESHDPTQGMRQGNDVGTQYRSAIYWTTPAQRDAALAAKAPMRRPWGQGLWPHHHGDRGGRSLLFRRNLSPAVSGEEPQRLLRAGRHRRHLPHRHGRCRLKQSRGRQSMKVTRVPFFTIFESSSASQLVSRTHPCDSVLAMSEGSGVP